jgi:hypothetical protein
MLQRSGQVSRKGKDIIVFRAWVIPTAGNFQAFQSLYHRSGFAIPGAGENNSYGVLLNITHSQFQSGSLENVLIQSGYRQFTF